MPRLSDLLNKLELGFYAVPEIQRPFVWRNSQVKDLADSIYNNMPIGAIIFWEMPKEFLKEYGDLVRPLTDDMPKEEANYMVIDGRQRLTSLLLLKKGSVKIEGKERKIELFFDVVTKSFVLGRSSDYQKISLFRVSDILSAKGPSEVLEKKAKEIGKEDLRNNQVFREEIEKLQIIFKTYDVPLIEAQLEYKRDNPMELFEKISKMFVLLNTQGTRVKLPDLVLALLTGKTRKEIGSSFREEFLKMLNEVEELDWEIDEAPLIRLFMAISTGTTKFKYASQVLEKKSAEDIFEFLKSTKDSIKQAIKFLRDELNVKDPKYLRSRYLVVPIAYFVYVYKTEGGMFSQDVVKDLAKWLVAASFRERYTGRLESDIYEDINAINEGKGVQGLLDNLGIREVTEEDLMGEYNKSHLTLLSIIYGLRGTKDWYYSKDSLVPSMIRNLSASEIHIHHIFPRDVLRKAYRGQRSPDEFANITLISKKANLQIRDSLTASKNYLEELYNRDPQLLKQHFIPTDPELWKVERYDDFLEERRKLILGSLNELLG